VPSLPKVPSIQLPGSVIDAATKAGNAAKAAAEAAVPSFGSLMDAAKASVTGAAGGLFKDTSAAVASVGAAQFGIGGDAPDLKAFEAYKQQVADVQKNAVIDMAIAKAGIAQKAMEATAAGKAIGGAAIAGALAATKSIQNLQANLSNPAALAADIAASAAAKADTIASLKANTMLAMLSKPLAAGLAAAMGAALNPSLVNDLTKLNIIKAQETDASQEPEGEAQPTDTVRPKDFTIIKAEEPTPPPITPPPVDKKVYAVELVKMSDKVAAAKSKMFKYVGINWKKGDPNPTEEVKKKAADDTISKIYDKVVGRDGANKERFQRLAIIAAKPNESDRTEEEKALIARVDVERNIFNTGEWSKEKDAVIDNYSKLFDRYKLAHDCWLNNGDRFSLPADIEKELKS
jgi:hypothetical protein